MALRITIVGDPQEREEVVDDLKVTLRLVMGEDPTLSVDFIPSEEYVSKTFKTGSEFLNKLMQTMTMAGDGSLSGITAKPAPAQSTRQHEEALRLSMIKTIGWLNSQAPGPQYYDWSYSLDSRSAGLTLFRIADEPLSAEAKGLVASVIRRDTGLDVAVQEQRLPRTLSGFRYPVSGSRLAQDLDGLLEMVRERDVVAATVRLKDPDSFRDARVRETTARMNETLLAYVRSRLPGPRISIIDPGDAWEVSLRVLTSDERSPLVPSKEE